MTAKVTTKTKKVTKRFRMDVDLDWSTLTCPCGASVRMDAVSYDRWKRRHRLHTDDGGRTVLEVNHDSAWSKCFSGPCPAPRVRVL